MKICSELCTGRCYSNKASQKKPPLLTASTKGSACAAEEGTGRAVTWGSLGHRPHRKSQALIKAALPLCLSSEFLNFYKRLSLCSLRLLSKTMSIVKW